MIASITPVSAELMALGLQVADLQRRQRERLVMTRRTFGELEGGERQVVWREAALGFVQRLQATLLVVVNVVVRTGFSRCGEKG